MSSSNNKKIGEIELIKNSQIENEDGQSTERKTLLTNREEKDSK